jgi:hypothetical protein
VTTLTYPYLGDAVQVGQPLGCDPTGWPYRVEAVQHFRDSAGDVAWFATTEVTVEPWPLPSPNPTDEETTALRAAQAHARDRLAGVIR